MEEGLKDKPSPPADGGSAHAGLLEAVMAVEENPSPTSSIGLFVITLILFFTSGLVHDDIREIGILIGVLLFHELGHLAAMKILGYRDVKMFFIPFLGAAVSGTSRTNSSARSCFVSLMGPLPGVIAAVVLLTLYALTNNFYALKTAQIMILLNVFNLLPIMPLDGGRYIDVLFIRNRFFRFVFALFGVACFAALAISDGDFVLGIVAVFSLLGAIANLRANKAARRLLDQGMREKTFAELAANPAMFDSVIAELRIAFPKAFATTVSAKNIHAHISNILTAVRFIPAGWAAKFGLSLLYGFILVCSLGLAIFFLALNPREKLKTTADSSLVMESWLFGRKISEIPLNRQLYLHGQGVKFGKDTNEIAARFEYANGYRVGRRIEFGPGMDTTEIIYYTLGRYDSSITFKAGKRILELPGDQSMWMRPMSWLRYHSQPRKSNHKLFRD